MSETTPTLERPPSPPPAAPPGKPEPPARVRTARFGEMDHHELVYLLESLDDERARSRFRESIYISLFIWLAIVAFLIYGPKYVFHQGKIITPVETARDKHEMEFLDLPRSLVQQPPKPAKVLSDQSRVAQTAHPTPDQKTLAQLEAMKRAGAPTAPPRPAPPTPQPRPTPQPQPQQTQPAAQQQTRNQTPPPPAPTPAPQPRNQAIPDAPRPSETTGRPSFATPTNPGQSIAEAARNAVPGRGAGGNYGSNASPSHPGLQSGIEVLSDTTGWDYGPYIRRLLAIIRANWLPLIPEETRPPISKEGMTLIRFSINRDGSLKVGSMKLDDSTHDTAIDKAAWGGIVSSNPMPPLPNEFKGPELTLRIQFNIIQYRNGQ